MNNIIDKLSYELDRCSQVLAECEFINRFKASNIFIEEWILYGKEAIESENIVKIITAINFLESIEPDFPFINKSKDSGSGENK